MYFFCSVMLYTIYKSTNKMECAISGFFIGLLFFVDQSLINEYYRLKYAGNQKGVAENE